MTAHIRVVDRPKHVRETTGGRLRRLRMAQGWSQEELAFRAGVTQQTVSAIERDDTGMFVYTLDALADALGVTLQYLWSGAVQCRHDGSAESAR